MPNYLLQPHSLNLSLELAGEDLTKGTAATWKERERRSTTTRKKEWLFQDDYILQQQQQQLLAANVHFPARQNSFSVFNHPHDTQLASRVSSSGRMRLQTPPERLESGRLSSPLLQAMDGECNIMRLRHPQTSLGRTDRQKE